MEASSERPDLRITGTHLRCRRPEKADACGDCSVLSSRPGSSGTDMSDSSLRVSPEQFNIRDINRAPRFDKISFPMNIKRANKTCPKCEHSRAFFMQIQTRSADEPMTTFYKCCNMQCGYRWRE